MHTALYDPYPMDKPFELTVVCKDEELRSSTGLEQSGYTQVYSESLRTGIFL
jgi:hypothetical protein